MPVSISKAGSGYRVSTPHGVKAKHTTLAKAKSQERLLNAVDHGWHPTHQKESVEAIKAMITEGRHKDGCDCGFCKNMRLLQGKKKDKSNVVAGGGSSNADKWDERKREKEKEEPKEPTEPPMQEGRDDINKLPMSHQAKAYARRGGLASMKAQPKQYINMVAADTNQQGKKKGFRNFDAEETTSGSRLGSKNLVVKKKGYGESNAAQVVDAMLNG